MRNLFEGFRDHRDLLVLILAVLSAFIFIFTGDSPQSVAMQRGMAGLVAAIPTPRLGIAEYLSYREENQVLRQRLMKLTLLNAEMADAGRENEHLRRLLDFSQSIPFEMRAADVISTGAATAITSVTINIGTDKSVQTNQPVLTTEGIVGKTIAVNRQASVVQLVTDRNFRLSVKVGPEGIRGILRAYRGLQGEISGIPRTAPIKPGHKVTTSGFSDIYPENLPVGVVQEVISRPGEGFKRARVQYHAQPSQTEHVFVLTRYGVGS